MQIQLKQPLTEARKKLIRKKYYQNEDRNLHSENAVLLATHFGTDADLADAQDILNQHKAIGHLPYELSVRRRELTQPLYKIMQQVGI